MCVFVSRYTSILNASKSLKLRRDRPCPMKTLSPSYAKQAASDKTVCNLNKIYLHVIQS